MLVRRENASLFAVVTTVFSAVFCGSGPTLRQARIWNMGWVLDISFDRWATEAWFNEEVTMFRGVYETDRVTAWLYGFTLDRFWLDIMYMVIIGVVFRVMAFGLLVLTGRRATI